MKKILIYLIFSNFLLAQKHLKTDVKSYNINVTDWILNTPEDKCLEDKFIILNFWSTAKNVQHNYDYIEQFNEFKKKFNQKDVYFITLTSEKKQAILNYFKNKRFEGIVVSDQKKITQTLYGNKQGEITIPLTILINKEGYIKWIGFPYLLTDEILNDFIKGKLKSYNMYEIPK